MSTRTVSDYEAPRRPLYAGDAAGRATRPPARYFVEHMQWVPTAVSPPFVDLGHTSARRLLWPIDRRDDELHKGEYLTTLEI
jgi:hypothetical protein